MKISGKSIKTLTKLFYLASGQEKVRFVVSFEQFLDPAISIGFESSSKNGDSLLPSIVGKVTSKNAIGEEKIRKDLGLKSESVCFFTSWRDWHGQYHSGVQVREIEKYPREYIKAQEERLYIIESDSGLYISTKEIMLSENNKIEILHLANLMLECFGEFEVFDSNKKLIVPPVNRQLDWDILPPGEYPWSKAKPIIGEVTKTLEQSECRIVEYRIEFLSKYKPDFLAMGRAGFKGYFIYGFSEKHMYFLESIYLGNATYVFGDNWEFLSKLTKNQIINGDVDYKRVIHDKKWESEIRKIFAKN